MMEAREKILGTIGVIQQEAQQETQRGAQQKIWKALVDLAEYLDSKVSIPPEPRKPYNDDELAGLLDYLDGAAKYGALGWSIVRETIAREISLFLEDWSCG